MKQRELMFNGQTFEINSGMIEAVSKRLEQTSKGYVTLREIKMETSENKISITVERKCPDFRFQPENHVSFQDIIILAALPFRYEEDFSRSTFSNITNFSMEIPEVVEEYNLYVRKRNRIKGLIVDSFPDYVCFTYQF